eukprot:CAMPEP_0115065852 /NCGR_PEP_ID=MMETSP0227-20121206/10485_1 /TAXON_ID=89957 /ORGANISM="Polarella glacialis, Strain CCMP 1383" /LENGTH=39 /DNA_ID= /DNA_START= /DNA_END= /DNA_ORIENTATION=
MVRKRDEIGGRQQYGRRARVHGLLPGVDDQRANPADPSR